jgi:eukaryotic-like serine/threonine-protein kinase
VLARFEAERQALAMMDHPNIAHVLDAGATPAGRPYFAMELVHGIPITTYCDQHNLDTRQRLELFRDVCAAVNHAHQKGVIHRDLKPSNVLVAEDDGKPVPKVIDFGIAKAVEQNPSGQPLLTRIEQFLGTPVYVSPEQAAGSGAGGMGIDTRSDIYSLGMVLYELLAGRPAFDPKTLHDASYEEMRRIIREVEPPRPSVRLSTALGEESESARLTATHGADPKRLGHQLEGDLDWIVMKCLEKDRARRYETANGLSADIQRHLNNEPVVARPASTLYRLRKAFRRNKLAFTVAVALLAGAIVSTWQAVEARRARDAEKEQRLRAEQSEAAIRLHLYVAKMNLAQQAWEQNNISRLRQLLDETGEFPGRGFEWYYWQRQCHFELKTLHLEGGPLGAISPDGQRIVTCGADSTARVWEVASGREFFTLIGHSSPISSVAFSPDGSRIATGSRDQTAIIWEAASGRDLLTLKGHMGWINSVAYSADGQRIVTSSADQTAKVWEAASGHELFTLRGHGKSVNSAAFSPDGERIATGSNDQTAKLWESATGTELLTLKGHEDYGMGWVIDQSNGEISHDGFLPFGTETTALRRTNGTTFVVFCNSTVDNNNLYDPVTSWTTVFMLGITR